MKILVTGASGFIGSYIVEEALRQGMETWAAVRPSSSKKYLQDDRIHFINLNLSSQEELEIELAPHEFDYIVHAAGVTKCLHTADFSKVNTEGTKHLVDAILHLRMPIKRFVFVSSLSVFGAIREEQPYQEISENDTPRPNTAYGKSKLAAERYLESIGNNFPYIILRPTGVYGPREKDYFLMAQSIKRHVDFAVGFKRQGHHLRVCAGRGAGRIPRPRPWYERQEILPQRRRSIPVGHFQRLDTQGAGQSMDAAHQGSCMGASHHHLLRRILRQDDRQDDGTEQRQVQHPEAAQLAMRHRTGHGRAGLSSPLSLGEGREVGHQMV